MSVNGGVGVPKNVSEKLPFASVVAESAKLPSASVARTDAPGTGTPAELVTLPVTSASAVPEAQRVSRPASSADLTTRRERAVVRVMRNPLRT